MRINETRQILRSFADDTRLRVINLLNEGELSVTDLCGILNVQQSNLSKHLSRMRAAGIVKDRREGMNVFYSLVDPEEKPHQDLMGAIIRSMRQTHVAQQDLAVLNELLQEAV